jgi:hypothetical protein
MDEGVLMGIFSTFSQEMINVQEYENISKAQAVSGEGLAHNFELLARILRAAPSGEIPGGSSKSAFQKVVITRPELNTSIYNISTFAGLRVDRLGVMLCHVRRLANDSVRLQQCASKCSGPSFKRVQELVGLIDLQTLAGDDATTTFVPEEGLRSLKVQPSYDSDGFPRALGKDGAQIVASCGSPPVAAKGSKPSPGAPKATRVLHRELSVDELGFPKLLSASPSVKRKLSLASFPTPTAPKLPGEALKTRLGLDDSHKPKVNPKEKPKEQAKAKAKAKAKPQPVDAGPPGWKDWSFMFYKNASSFAIRRKHEPKNQIFSFKSKSPMSPELKKQCTRLCKLCIIKLLEGESEARVHAWVLTQVP